MGTRGQWGIDFAKALGNENPSDSTVNFIAAWTKGENTAAKYNPLATTLDYGNNTVFNSAGVRSFNDRQTGIAATVQTLQGGYPGYTDIREGIRLNDPQRASNGLIRAPWGTNGALVQNIWALYDVRSEPLKSETDTPKEGSNGSTLPPDAGHGIDAGKQHYTPGTMPNPGNLEEHPAGYPTAGQGQRILYIGGGIVLVFISVYLIIRQYVPTQQIVRTVEAVAT